LWVSGPIQKVAYALTAIILGGVSAYRIWAREHDEKLTEINKRNEMERKYFDEQPKLGFDVHSDEGPRRWALNHAPVVFTLTHLGGRIPTNIRFDPILSQKGKFTLQLDPLAHVKPSHAEPAAFDILENGVPSLSAVDREAQSNYMRKEMLELFLLDSEEFSGNLEYRVVINFTDRDEQRRQEFLLTFETNRYRFSPNTSINVTQKLLT
jgi:hypothetical protein